MILIGSKPYKLELNNIIDNFEKLVRFNMAIKNNNNGTKEPLYQVINIHVYNNIKSDNKNTLVEKYNYSVKKKHIEDFFDEFKNSDKIKYIYNNGTDLMKIILEELNIDINITKQLRVGYGIIAENIQNNIFSYLIGYSIDIDNINLSEKSFYINENFNKINNDCHDINIEIKILHELHKKNIIDCSLCLLNNQYELPLLDCKNIKPRKEIILLLLKQYGICILENYFENEIIENLEKEYENIFNNYNDKIFNLDTENCSKDERIFHCEKYSEYIKKIYSDNQLFDTITKIYTQRNFNKKTLINKLEYNSSEIRNSGAGYHRDNHDCQFKTIMYLTDVNKKNGCFTFITNSSKKHIGYPKPRTEDYNTRYYDETIEELLEKNEKCKKIEICGKKGTIILVDTTYIHRGKIIEEGIRKAITQYYF